MFVRFILFLDKWLTIWLKKSIFYKLFTFHAKEFSFRNYSKTEITEKVFLPRMWFNHLKSLSIRIGIWIPTIFWSDRMASISMLERYFSIFFLRLLLPLLFYFYFKRRERERERDHIMWHTMGHHRTQCFCFVRISSIDFICANQIEIFLGFYLHWYRHMWAVLTFNLLNCG